MRLRHLRLSGLIEFDAGLKMAFDQAKISQVASGSLSCSAGFATFTPFATLTPFATFTGFATFTAFVTAFGGLHGAAFTTLSGIATLSAFSPLDSSALTSSPPSLLAS